MAQDRAPDFIADDAHPIWLAIVDVTVSDILAGLRQAETLTYCLARFNNLVEMQFGPDLNMPTSVFRAAYRTALHRTGANAISVGAWDLTQTLDEWANDRGLLGLVGLYVAGSASKLFLNHPSALVLCRIEFAR